MSNQETIGKILDINQPMDKSPIRFSMLAILLRAAREFSGVEVTSGIYKMDDLNMERVTAGSYYSFKYSGLLNYLVLLEQLGRAFKKVGSNLRSETPILNVLSEFTQLEKEKKESIFALRNSLAHNFGLATQLHHSVGGPKKFSLRPFDRNNEIIIPNTSWKSFDDKTDNHTIVYTIDLIELIERIYSEIVSRNNNETIELRIGRDELFTRYTFVCN